MRRHGLGHTAQHHCAEGLLTIGRARARDKSPRVASWSTHGAMSARRAAKPRHRASHQAMWRETAPTSQRGAQRSHQAAAVNRDPGVVAFRLDGGQAQPLLHLRRPPGLAICPNTHGAITAPTRPPATCAPPPRCTPRRPPGRSTGTPHATAHAAQPPQRRREPRHVHHADTVPHPCADAEAILEGPGMCAPLGNWLVFRYLGSRERSVKKTSQVDKKFEHQC